MEEWNTYKLSEVCSRLRSGKIISSSLVSSSGDYPVIGGNGVRGYSSQSNFDGECGIIGRQGAYCGNVRFFSGIAYMTEHAIVVVGNDKADTYYLTALLSTMNLGHLSAQSAQPGLSVQTLSKIEITLPSVATQRRVTAMLKSIDDKIELNSRINHNLEQQAQALYKSWFVDFEPFKGGKFVDSELGMIPEGWRVGPLSDIASIVMGQSPSGSSYNEIGEGTIFYQGRTEFGARFPSIRLFTTEPTRFAEKNSVLLSVRAPVGDINIAKEKCCIGRGLAAIYGTYQSFVFYTIDSLRPLLARYNGEGTVFGSINRKDLESIAVVVPPVSIQNAFNTLVMNLDDEIFRMYLESDYLAQIRDTLLPRLMSGELKIYDLTC